MKKYFKTKLLQCDRKQGYVCNDKELSDETYWSLFYRTSNAVIDDIMVEQTINPFYVQEILTGLSIPVLHCTKDLESNNKENDSVFFPFGKIHTFVSVLHNKNKKRDIVIGLGDPASVDEIEKYIASHQDIETWREKLVKHFTEGKEIMDAKTEEEKQDEMQRVLKRQEVK